MDARRRRDDAEDTVLPLFRADVGVVGDSGWLGLSGCDAIVAVAAYELLNFLEFEARELATVPA